MLPGICAEYPGSRSTSVDIQNLQAEQIATGAAAPFHLIEHQQIGFVFYRMALARAVCGSRP